MAATDSPSHSASLAVNSYDTALCIIPPKDQCHGIDSLRSLYDKGYGRWPPHVNILYPFVSPESLPQAKEKIQSMLSNHVQNMPNARLDKAGYFTHRANNTIFLRETNFGRHSPFQLMRSVVATALGQKLEQYNPHLTIGQSEDKTDSSRDFLLSKARLLPSLAFEIGHLAILVRERVAGQATSSSRMKLWGTIPLTAPASSQGSPLSEFWLQASSQLIDGPVSDEEESRSDDAAVSSFSREVRPGTTYKYSPHEGSWTPTFSNEDDTSVSDAVRISSYNVLIDSEYPPARDRDPLLVQTLLSQSALADILVLQEVSDDFLSYLLSNASVREQYPYTSHGPPSQPEVAPLPSLRNIVVLSKWPFKWEFVPFHRRHKGAVVAVFESITKHDKANSLPLVVAGVHLTCGLTDGSVAVKKIQLQNLKNHLTRKYAANPWIIAGDFNITTSTYTIDTALKNKSISQQSARTLSSLENIMTDVGLLDAWSVARIEGMERTTTDDADDLFEGEDGATFNPRENHLAAATSGTSNNRPQRYDRILFRPQTFLNINSFNHFGLPNIQEGIQVVPSDHSGIRASMKLILDPQRGNDLNILQQYPVELRQNVLRSTDSLELQSALSIHKMLPTEDEIRSRREAFELVKEVVLGSTNDEDSSSSSVPLVMVPVGSYAMGTWTSSSDIDCLCIGSISSKTFFKLARHRIFKAQARGIRLIRKVDANTGTMFELSVGDVALDLQYCPAAAIVER